MKLLSLFVLLFFSLSSFANIVVGRVNMQKVILSVSDGQKVRDQIKGDFDKKQKEIQKEEESIKSAQESYQKQALVMSDDAKGKKEKEIQQMIVNIQKKTMDYQKQIQKMEEDLMGPVLERLKTVINDVSTKESVDLTVESGSTPILLYAKKEVDLSDKIISEYNKKHPSKK